MKNFKKRKLNEAHKKKASKKTSTRRVRSTDPGEPDSPTAEDEIRAKEIEDEDFWADNDREREMENSSTEYHRLGYVLAEALRVKDEEPRRSNAYVRALLGEDKREQRGAPGSTSNPEMEHTPPKKRGGPAKRFRTVKGKDQVSTQNQDRSWGPWRAGR